MRFQEKTNQINRLIGWIPACPQLHAVRAEAVEIHDLGTAGIIRESPRVGLDNALTPRSRKTESGTSSLDASPKRRMTLEHERALVFAFFILAAPIYAGELGGNLVDPARLQNPPIEEIRYATKYNFTGEPLYPFPAAFLQRDTATSLEKVQE